MIRNEKGFTLIELMVVIVIIGILAALAIPKFSNASDKAKWSEAPTVLAAYENAQLAHVAEKGAIGDTSALVFDAPSNSKWFDYAQGTSAGIFEGAIQTGKSIGTISAGDGIKTTVNASGNISHDVISATSKTAIEKMIPNFF